MKCPNCSSSQSSARYRLTDFNIMSCGQCGLLYNDQFPPKESKEAAFSGGYYCDVQKKAFQFHGDEYLMDPSVPVFQRWLSAVGKPAGSLLDVGCGLGTFLGVARDAGWRVQGLDISPFAAKTVKEKMGIDVFNGSLVDAPWTDQSFDVITFWDSIEHVDNPKQYLEKARALLKPDGVLLIATDNFDCFGCDIARLSYALTGGLLTYAMKRFYIPYNATYFTEEQFRALVQSCGLEIFSFEKMEYPLEKINATFLERGMLLILYALAKMTHRQAQFTLLARKEVPAGTAGDAR
jgi:2-polyprenyl-3-methyl-5-hydroxy-6-metoxy-1,4-benzoquinol methylase